MPRTDYAFLRRLTLLPARATRVLPGQTVVVVDVAAMGPRRVWPGTDDIHPMAWESMPLVPISAADTEHTVAEDEYWTTRMRGAAEGRVMFALVDDDGRRYVSMTEHV